MCTCRISFRLLSDLILYSVVKFPFPVYFVALLTALHISTTPFMCIVLFLQKISDDVIYVISGPKKLTCIPNKIIAENNNRYIIIQ